MPKVVGRKNGSCSRLLAFRLPTLPSRTHSLTHSQSTLNVIDEAALKEVGSTGFVVVVESFSKRNGLGIRFGSWLLEAGYSPKFARLGTHHEGSGGLFEHYPHQKIDSASVQAQIKSMV